jgi:hypothetical protein
VEAALSLAAPALRTTIVRLLSPRAHLKAAMRLPEDTFFFRLKLDRHRHTISRLVQAVKLPDATRATFENLNRD